MRLGLVGAVLRIVLLMSLAVISGCVRPPDECSRLGKVVEDQLSLVKQLRQTLARPNGADEVRKTIESASGFKETLDSCRRFFIAEGPSCAEFEQLIALSNLSGQLSAVHEALQPPSERTHRRFVEQVLADAENELRKKPVAASCWR